MASFATQVQIRRGTEAENNAFTGAEGEVTMDLTNKQLRVHDGQTTGGMKIPNIETVFGTSQIQDGAITEPKLSTDLQTKINEKTSGAGRNIGDIFWTTRTDSALNGAVEANGAQYNFADVNGGNNNVQALLESGALPSVPIAEFDSFDAMVAEQGGCDSFGYGERGQWQSWRGSGDIIYLQRYPIVGDNVFDSIDGSIIGTVSDVRPDETTYMDYLPTGSETPVTNFSVVDYFNYIILPTTYFKVPKKLGRVLVRSQKPTADNDHTWYNVYADGWVEQGGYLSPITTGSNQSISLLVEMLHAKYTANITLIGTGTNDTGFKTVHANTKTLGYIVNAGDGNTGINWQVSGYAAPAEYTKDKWDYQNVQVERPMVQLFNSATDEAVAKCTEVLSDVAGLKQTTDGMIDYVVESQEPTEANGYTWYRLYKSGWVEQGGRTTIPSTDRTVTFLVEMQDTDYSYQASGTSSTYGVGVSSLTTTSMKLDYAGSATGTASWQVSGMSAQGSN